MPLTYTAAFSSRITKSTTKSPAKRSSSSISGSRARKSAKSSRTAKGEQIEDGSIERLPDQGLVRSISVDRSRTSMADQIRQINEQMFEDIPQRAGMNSTRIAEVLNYRRTLPPMVTVAHVHALSHAPTTTERGIAEAIQQNFARRITIPGRGVGSSAVGDCLILIENWVKLVEDCELHEHLRQKYIEVIRKSSSLSNIRSGHFTPSETIALLRAGFLTSASQSLANTTSLVTSDTSSIGTLASLSTVGSRAASGSLAAVGGDNAIHNAGGGGRTAFRGSEKEQAAYGAEYTLSVPSMGLYMKLLEAARTHMLSILSKSRYKEAPKYLLKERWDGGVVGEAKSSNSGPLAGVLPGRTKKWKQFYGLSFDWVLAECLGSGQLELFETGSVGHGIRLN